MILSEDGDATDPDDDAKGGIFSFDWEEPVIIHSIGVLDVNDLPGGIDSGRISTFDAAGELIDADPILGFGENNFQEIAINDDMVRSLQIELAGSGAITEVKFERFYKNTATVSVNGYSGVTASDVAYYRNSTPNLQLQPTLPGQFELASGQLSELMASTQSVI